MKITSWSQLWDFWNRTDPTLPDSRPANANERIFWEAVHAKFPRLMEALRIAERSRAIIEAKNKRITELEEYIKQLH